jgi:hypothetical protein
MLTREGRLDQMTADESCPAENQELHPSSVSLLWLSAIAELISHPARMIAPAMIADRPKAPTASRVPFDSAALVPRTKPKKASVTDTTDRSFIMSLLHSVF